MADENTMPEIPDDINLDDDAFDEATSAPSGKSKKISLNFGNSKLMKILMWVGIGSVVIIAEVVIAYVLINKFFMEKQIEQLEQNTTVQTQVLGGSSETEKGLSLNNMDLPELNYEPAPDMKKVGGTYTFADLVVNPAFSQGKRYFVVTVICVFEDKKMVDKVTALDAVVQDRLNTLLSSKTTQWYSNYNNRHMLKREIMAVIMQTLDLKDGLKVYFTKYVIQ